jgi:DNA (cytosine-5)-methyltransferase 1
MTARPRLLDLFCCQGGAAAGYHRAGFNVVGVDCKPQPRFPFAFAQLDALEYVARFGKAFDAIHASPPCQAHSVTRRYGSARKYPDLIAATRAALEETGRPYVIENVPGSPLRRDLELCGTGFGLRVIRHRWFESNVWLGLAPPCNHWSHTGQSDEWRKNSTTAKAKPEKKGAFVSPAGNPNKEKGSLAEWLICMECGWMDRAGVTQAIPPAYTEYIGRALLRCLENSETKST